MSAIGAFPNRPAILIRRGVALCCLAVLALLLTVSGHPATTARAVPAPVTLDRPGPEPGLDRSGRALPATAYPIPAGAVFLSPSGDDAAAGTQVAPVRTLNRAISLAPAGGTVVLRGGEYRDWYHRGGSYGIVTKSLTFQAFPGESPWLNGADVVPGPRWSRVAGRTAWRLPWSTPEFCDGRYYERPLKRQLVRPNAGPCGHYDMSRDRAYPLAVDPQAVFLDNRELRQVTSLAKLRRDTFFYDWKARRLYLGTNPAGRTVEVSRRPVALVLGARQTYRVLGLGFRRYASNEFPNQTNAALRIGAVRSVVENSVFTENAAAGLTLSNPEPGTVVRRNVFAGNGYVGLGANGGSIEGTRNDLLVTGNVFSGNNAQRFGTRCTVSCGQAAAKFAHMVGIRLSSNLVERTRGRAPGLWCDLDCRDAQIVRNEIRGNAGGAGIFYEVSSRGVIAGNLSTGNLYGISVSSADTRVYNNTLVDNRQGIRVYDDQRSPGRGGWTDIGPDTRRVEVVNNVITGPGSAFLAYPMRKNRPRPNTGAENLFARLDHNAVFQGSRRPVYVFWRTRTGRTTLFRSRADFARKAGLGQAEIWVRGSRNPFFVDQAGGDLRLSTRSTAYGSAASPPQNVADALGLPPDAIRHRGALG